MGLAFQVVAKTYVLSPENAIALTEIQMMRPLLCRAFNKVPASRHVAVASVFVTDEIQICDEWLDR
jgi:hypothetical protein